MWGITFVILFSIAGLDVLNAECVQKDMEKCEERALYDNENSEKMTDECSYFLRLSQCATDALEKCSYDEKTSNVTKKMAKYLKEICDPDNEIYNAIKDDLSCVTSTFKVSKFCRYIVHEKSDDITYVPDKCEASIMDVTCQSVGLTGKCDEVSKDAILDLVMNTNYDFMSSCTEQEIQWSRDLIPILVADILEDINRKDK